jgi:hypothetical protein
MLYLVSKPLLIIRKADYNQAPRNSVSPVFSNPKMSLK